MTLMATYRLGSPSELKRSLEYALPRQYETYAPVVRVAPRDAAFRKCAVWAAEMYEIQAFYTTTDADSLDQLEDALGEMPEVFLTAQVRPERGRNTVTNPVWPAPLGVSRRGFHELRPQVLALIVGRSRPARRD
jgi:hypothetical protein